MAFRFRFVYSYKIDRLTLLAINGMLPVLRLEQVYLASPMASALATFLLQDMGKCPLTTTMNRCP